MVITCNFTGRFLKKNVTLYWTANILHPDIWQANDLFLWENQYVWYLGIYAMYNAKSDPSCAFHWICIVRPCFGHFVFTLKYDIPGNAHKVSAFKIPILVFAFQTPHFFSALYHPKSPEMKKLERAELTNRLQKKNWPWKLLVCLKCKYENCILIADTLQAGCVFGSIHST